MGCSSSAISPEGEVKANGVTEKQQPASEKKHSSTQGYQNGHIKSSQTNESRLPKKTPNVDNNANKLNPLAQAPVPKSVAFDITLDEQSDGLLPFKRRPPRLQTLEPLNVPKLTADQLAEKQRLAEEKRERLKQKKINTSQKSSRRRKELLKAREFGMKQQIEQEKTTIDDNLKQAELKREQKLLEIKEKQRLREERARRIREKAKRIQNPDDEVEVEKDETFNATSDDSWLSAEKQHNNPNSAEGEVEDDEEGLHKKMRQVRPTASASTVDSYDAAFMRHGERERRPLQSVHHQQKNLPDMNDEDFFGS